MKNNKMKIAELKVKSFVTRANNQTSKVQGGGGVYLSKGNPTLPVCRTNFYVCPDL